MISSGRLGRSVAIAGLALASLVGLLVAADRTWPFPFERLDPPPARVVRASDGTPLRFFLPGDDRYRFPVTLEQVSPAMVDALLGSEDRWFWWHPGVNPLAIVRATVANLRAGRVVSGASTISMQVARLAEPRPRTLVAKIQDAARALQLEWHCSKSEILAAYLNLTPYGGNIEGVGAAAWFYFGKHPERLSIGEAALLTALPRSPLRYDPTRNPEAAEAARDRVLRQLEVNGALTSAQAEEARRHAVPETIRRAPFLAPHFAQAALGAAPVRPADIRTTLVLETQHRAEAAVAGRIEALRQEGIGNAAVVVLDNKSRAVLAMVGSAGFFDADRSGQVNAALASRSPGSTLKPFLYAMAIDSGEIVPQSWLLDVPTDFSGYVAQNYDGEYRGRVTAAAALRQSLNAPAVRLLSRLGLADFHRLLVDGGLATLDHPASHYGLPLVLGAGEVRLVDLVNLYAALAEGGTWRPFTLVDGPSPGTARRLLSRQAAGLVTEILLEVGRPDMPEAWSLTRDVPAVAWKTGTSYGHRDAWAVGYSRDQTIGVWVGNPDGRASKGISGSHHAGPLLFDLFRALGTEGVGPATTDSGIDTIRVCAESHDLPGPFCPRTVEVRTVAGVTHHDRCNVHRRVFVDIDTGHRLAGSCLAERPHAARVLSVWPAELVAWQRAQGQRVNPLPGLSPLCTDVPDRQPPRIISPDSGTPYLLRRDTPSSYQGIALTVRADQGTERLYWYQNGELVAAGRPTERLFVTPLKGEHEVVVVDDSGRSDTVRYRVQ